MPLTFSVYTVRVTVARLENWDKPCVYVTNASLKVKKKSWWWQWVSQPDKVLTWWMSHIWLVTHKFLLNKTILKSYIFKKIIWKMSMFKLDNNSNVVSEFDNDLI